MLNQLPKPSSVRQPRGVVRIKTDALSWQVLTGWIECEVEENSFAAADTFRMVLAVNALQTATDASWFSKQTSIEVEIYAGFPANPESFEIAELALLIVGIVDHMEYSPADGTINLSGRDKTGLFIDTKTAEGYRSQTASQVVKQLAARHGMDAVVIDTKTKVGNNYAEHSDTLNTSQSEWDILTKLAKNEGFACYVKGNALHFEPMPTEDIEPYVLRWELPNAERASPLFNGKSLSFERALTVAKGVSVIATSQPMNAKLPLKAVYPTAGTSSVTAGQSKAHVQVFNIEARPGMSKADLIKLAQAKYHEIVSHEMKMTADLPGDNLLSARNLLKVEGTGTAYDQTYFPDSISRKLSERTGYTMHVSAKNLSPNNPV